MNVRDMMVEFMNQSPRDIKLFQLILQLLSNIVHTSAECAAKAYRETPIHVVLSYTVENVPNIEKTMFDMMTLLAHGVTRYQPEFSLDDQKIFLNIAWIGLTLPQDSPVNSMKMLLSLLKPKNADISDILPPKIINTLCSLVRSENQEIPMLAMRVLSIATCGEGSLNNEIYLLGKSILRPRPG